MSDVGRPGCLLQVKIAASILRDAEVGVDTYTQFNYLRNFTPKPMPSLEVGWARGCSSRCA